MCLHHAAHPVFFVGGLAAAQELSPLLPEEHPLWSACALKGGSSICAPLPDEIFFSCWIGLVE